MNHDRFLMSLAEQARGNLYKKNSVIGKKGINEGLVSRNQAASPEQWAAERGLELPPPPPMSSQEIAANLPELARIAAAKLGFEIGQGRVSQENITPDLILCTLGNTRMLSVSTMHAYERVMRNQALQKQLRDMVIAKIHERNQPAPVQQPTYSAKDNLKQLCRTLQRMGIDFNQEPLRSQLMAVIKSL